MSNPLVYLKTDVKQVRYNGKEMSVVGADLPEGAGIMIHPDGRMEIVENIDQLTKNENARPYSSALSRSLPLNTCSGDDEADSILFYSTLSFPFQFEEMKEVGKFVERWRYPLYHANVLWSYALRLTREESDAYSISFVSVGSHMGPAKHGADNNLPGLTAPPIMRITMFMNMEQMALESSANGFTVIKRYTEEELAQLKGDAPIKLSILLTVPRFYFNLASIIDLNANTTVPAGTEDVVATILRGEKPDDADWEITAQYACGCECAGRSAPSTVFYVHKSEFAMTSPAVETVLDSLKDGDAITLLNGGTRGQLNDLTLNGVKLAIHIAYGMEVPLPSTDDYVSSLIDNLDILFGAHFTSVVIPQWERAICKKALELDLRDESSSMPSLLHLLNIIWEAPYGFFPVAKRVTIGVLTDMAHLNTKTTLAAWLQESMLAHTEASGIELRHVGTIMAAFWKVMNMVPHVDKIAQSAEGQRVDRQAADGEEEQGDGVKEE